MNNYHGDLSRSSFESLEDMCPESVKIGLLGFKWYKFRGKSLAGGTKFFITPFGVSVEIFLQKLFSLLCVGINSLNHELVVLLGIRVVSIVVGLEKSLSNFGRVL